MGTMRLWAMALVVGLAWAGAAGCSDDDDVVEENTAATCSDNKDNDGDGLMDCADPDCQALAGCKGGDLGVDGAVVDGGPGVEAGADGGKPDGPAPDKAMTDGARPDRGLPDGPSPDSVTWRKEKEPNNGSIPSEFDAITSPRSSPAPSACPTTRTSSSFRPRPATASWPGSRPAARSRRTWPCGTRSTRCPR